eukprot:3144097-Pyramimonas_sp.AAC.1
MRKGLLTPRCPDSVRMYLRTPRFSRSPPPPSEHGQRQVVRKGPENRQPHGVIARLPGNVPQEEQLAAKQSVAQRLGPGALQDALIGHPANVRMWNA